MPPSCARLWACTSQYATHTVSAPFSMTRYLATDPQQSAWQKTTSTSSALILLIVVIAQTQPSICPCHRRKEGIQFLYISELCSPRGVKWQRWDKAARCLNVPETWLAHASGLLSLTSSTSLRP